MSRGEIVFAATSGLVVLGIAIAALLHRKWIFQFLTPEEWKTYFKIIAIVLCALLLLLTDATADSSGEGFIYGNF